MALAAVGFFLTTVVLSPEKLAPLLGVKESGVNEAFEQMNNQNVLIGLIIGLVAAYTYNRFSKTELPTALSFFSGKRLAPILTAFFSIFIAVIMLFVWPIVYSAIVAFGTWILDLGPGGRIFIRLFNRLLIPTGLHHALNAVFWFDLASINDIAKFQTGDGAVQGITGLYGWFLPSNDVWDSSSSISDVSYC